VKKLGVRANADNPHDSEVAIKFGAHGIGLCRTEHMFFEPERILAVREMIFAKDKPNREKALAKLLPYQVSDFKGIFKVMNGLPVNIRLLDPPLHEFLPHSKEDKQELADALGLPLSEIEERGDKLHEFNPMLGHRGCRLAITFPEIYNMQARAIATAAVDCAKEKIVVKPEIMIPLVALGLELKIIKTDVINEVEKVFSETGTKVDYKVGTMIELPRAAIMAGEIAKDAQFFSFGTNDLTQTTFGLSRDDAGKFLPEYVSKGIMGGDPFVSLDQEGVGFLVKHAVSEGKKTNPQMHMGICGEHGGEPRSIEFCHKAGLDYVSCSPFRVPIARLAAAQAAIKNK
ncbi:MAG: pyruvate, phosphate dikinase, partial [Bdellovibrionales bacterium]|nr:pyruvate, phosphate dikinase [Bdellovibrionales bacterium]